MPSCHFFRKGGPRIVYIHVVRQGDTLWELSRRWETSTPAIASANGINEAEPLVIGQALIIPIRFGEHRVRYGESLWSIAHRYGLTLTDLLKANPAVIQPGQIIQLPQASKPVIEVNAYTQKFGAPGVQLINQIGSALTYLSPFSYRVQGDGSMLGLDETDLIAAAYGQRIAPMMVISNFEDGTFSPDIAHALLNDPAARQRLIAGILSIMQQKGYKALNVDFEYVPPADRELYNGFLEQLVTSLRPRGYLVSTCLAPKQKVDQIGTLYEAHDYAAHGRIVDFVILMTYEWGWSGGAPRAVAPLNEVVQVLNYALSVIPAAKVVMGMPLYGYDWTLPYVKGNEWAPTVSPVAALETARTYGAEILYDEEAQSPYFYYYDRQGREHVVWFEDARSVQAKFGIVKAYKLRGVSYWVLGVPFPQNWTVLEANFTIKKLV
jgi:spore germination protein